MCWWIHRSVVCPVFLSMLYPSFNAHVHSFTQQHRFLSQSTDPSWVACTLCMPPPPPPFLTNICLKGWLYHSNLFYVQLHEKLLFISSLWPCTCKASPPQTNLHFNLRSAARRGRPHTAVKECSCTSRYLCDTEAVLLIVKRLQTQSSEGRGIIWISWHLFSLGRRLKHMLIQAAWSASGTAPLRQTSGKLELKRLMQHVATYGQGKRPGSTCCSHF